MTEKPLHCVLIDEAQFLSKRQVLQLGRISDHLGHPGTGLRITNRFPGGAL